MTDPDQANAAFAAVRTSGVAVLTILRAGKTFDVSVDAGTLSDY